MIRIKNISRENPRIKVGRYDIIYPSGRRERLLMGREITINYATYILNKTRIVLPGEPLHGSAAFRVMSGVDEIRKNEMPTTVDPELKPDVIIAPEKPETTVEDPNGGSVIETGEANSPEPDDDISAQDVTLDQNHEVVTTEDTGEVTTEDIAEEITDEGPKVQPVETVTEPVATKEPATAGKYTEDALRELTHKGLNELLAKEGIKVPEPANKQHKIDALMKLNG